MKPQTNDQYMVTVLADRCRMLETKLLAMVTRITELEMEKKGGLNATKKDDNQSDKT